MSILDLGPIPNPDPSPSPTPGPSPNPAVCDSKFGDKVATCAELKKFASCAQLVTLNDYQTKLKALGCSKDQADAQWNNVHSCLCGEKEKGLSVPVIIIISVAGAVVLGVVIYLLARKKK